MDKGGDPAPCNDVDEPGGHHAERGQSDTERQALHGLSYMWTLTSSSSQSREQRGGRQGCARGTGRWWSGGTESQLCRGVGFGDAMTIW